MAATSGRTRHLVRSQLPRALRVSSARKGLRVLGLALALAFAVLAGPSVGPASAHAYLTASSPADGESLTVAPTELRLEFSEHVVPESTRIVLTDGSGRAYPVTKVRAEAEEATPSSPEEAAAEAAGVVDTEEPLAVVADLPKLPEGAYHVTWETLSSDDLHRTAGGFAFGINTAVVADSARGVTETPPDLVDATWRTGVLIGLGLALGTSLVSQLFRRAFPGRDRRPLSGVTRVGVAAALGAVVAAAVGFAVELTKVGGSAISSSYAVRSGVREAALVLLVLALVRGARPAWAATAGLVAAIATVLLGHTGLRGGLTWTAASALHVWAGAAWFGAVTLLAGIALRRRRIGLDGGEVRTLLREFFAPAAFLVATVAVTGLYLAGDTIVSVDAAVGTVYGRVLIAKVLLSVAVGVVAVTTTRRLHRRAGRAGRASDASVPGVPDTAGRADGAGRSPRRRVALEAAGLGVMVLLAAVLASGQPAIAPALVDRAGPPPSRILDRTVDDLQETLTVSPNHPGDSVVTLDVFDARRPSPGPVTGVTVSVPGSGGHGISSVPAHRLADQKWAAGVRLRASGTTPVRVTVHRQGMASTVTTFHWVVGPLGSPPAPVLSRAPISGPLQLGSLGLLVVLTLVGALAWRRRTRRLRPAQGLRRLPSAAAEGHAPSPAGLAASPAGLAASPEPVPAGAPVPCGPGDSAHRTAISTGSTAPPGDR
ncbi:MAG TPA: copper resistance protein CopC [Segeticoccus sp.]|uniref:copper resistance CopC/CopD family protein n=1 Tax=Segeticoccus sp. TaxID=2706531 RepID=UPI002D7E372F|nr:copper resistance protein CopC [Segeticoccus sp.]HET8600578.1 copper resistance protein CopC [Segeticoccus sp.]